NRAAAALRLAAQSLNQSQSALGAYFRRLKAHIGAPKALTAAAYKLARILYRMLKYGAGYVDQGEGAYEERYRDRLLHNLKRRAAELGFQLTAIDSNAAPTRAYLIRARLELLGRGSLSSLPHRPRLFG